MKKLSIVSIGSLTLSILAGATIATVYADDTSVICEQIKEAMTRSRPGTTSYIRMQDQYNRNCLEIKSGCPSKASLEVQAQGCKNAGMYAIYYSDPSSCRQVRCSEVPPTSSSSSSARSSSSIASATGPCPNGNMLTEVALGCKKKDLKYEYYTARGCRQVRCIEKAPNITCPSPSELTQKVRECKKLGRDYERYTRGVCQMIRCIGEEIDNASSSSSSSIRSVRQGVKPSTRRFQ